MPFSTALRRVSPPRCAPSSKRPHHSSGSRVGNMWKSSYAETLYGSFLHRYGSLQEVPADQRLTLQKVCQLSEAEELTLVEKVHQQETRRANSPSLCRPSSARAGSKMSINYHAHYVPPICKSKVASYIRDRPHSARSAAVVSHDTHNLRRVLNEIQLRMPALKRLQQQHHIDLDTEEGQVASFSDVYTLLDEDGSGGVSQEEFVAFGRRVGGECAKVFNKHLFARLDVTGEGDMTKEAFLAVLFPVYTRRKARQLEEQRKKKEKVEEWTDYWRKENLQTVTTVFLRTVGAAARKKQAVAMCEADGKENQSIAQNYTYLSTEEQQKILAKGTISFADLMDSFQDEEFVKTQWTDSFALHDTDHDGWINFVQFADMLYPTFSKFQGTQGEITDFYFENNPARW